MSSIWIILLDTSGSMGEGFSEQSGGAADPLGESGAWKTKLDAAKDILLRQVKSLRAQDISILSFTDSYEKIYQGPKDSLLKKPGLIRGLNPGGGTSIATALDGVTDDTEFENYRSLTVLVITDGLSDKEAASKAAEALVSKFPFARIDTILIDETEEGRVVAEDISINGTVRTATSSIQLRQAVSGARLESLRSELSNMALLRFQAQRELSSFEQMAQPTLVRVTTRHSLTASILKNDVAPTLAGIEAIGRAASRASRCDYLGSVSSISQDSPISINLTGLKESVELVLTYVIPWRRKNAEKLAALDVRKHEIEVERQERDLAMQDLELEKRRLENIRIQYELANSKWELAEKMLKSIKPNVQIDAETREQVMANLLAGIDQLSTTMLEFDVVRDIPRQ